MWLAYVEYKSAYNLVSAVENLAQHLRHLQFDAEHEAVYGMDQFYNEEECTKIAKNYEKGVEACNLYLHTSDLTSFLETIKELGLTQFLEEVEKFAPKNIFKRLKINFNKKHFVKKNRFIQPLNSYYKNGIR
ncbi:unnamed protein product [Ceutorhynchus assimilis]|uniref:Uncharacterized protein n=1 Tax=Ceutorhynchus assimilis TaxID=467358 RepID=A0A9N9MSY6_9CUCU|nr:unnamed protein product [Ceutorhynchus assimilis]